MKPEKKYYAYILQSEVTNRKYHGSCEDVAVRLARHNAGKVKSTKAYKPYCLLYFEEFYSRSEAYRREVFFKTIEGYEYLKNLSVI